MLFKLNDCKLQCTSVKYMGKYTHACRTCSDHSLSTEPFTNLEGTISLLVTFVHLVGDDHVLQRCYTFFCLSLQFLQGFRTFKHLYHLCTPCHSCKKQFVAQTCLIYMYNMCMWQLKLYYLIGPTDIQNLEYMQ